MPENLRLVLDDPVPYLKHLGSMARYLLRPIIRIRFQKTMSPAARLAAKLAASISPLGPDHWHRAGRDGVRLPLWDRADESVSESIIPAVDWRSILDCLCPHWRRRRL